jgi:hypothetical protein
MAENLKEIPRREWIRFLDEFTREHQGWQVRVEVRDPEAGPEDVEVHDLPLQGISADDRGSEHDVSIIVGDEQNPGLTHIIPGARRVLVRRTEAGNDEGLEIEAADGSRTIVQLQQVRRAA